METLANTHLKTHARVLLYTRHNARVQSKEDGKKQKASPPLVGKQLQSPQTASQTSTSTLFM